MKDRKEMKMILLNNEDERDQDPKER